jgi:hypothetical protein
VSCMFVFPGTVERCRWRLRGDYNVGISFEADHTETFSTIPFSSTVTLKSTLLLFSSRICFFVGDVDT